jgi:hypothetical protein
MAIYNLIPYKIRVLVNRDHYDIPRPNIPLDIEGTCLELNTHGNKYINKLFNAGKVLDIVFGEQEGADILVRWDNDTKATMYSGSLVHRSSSASKCISIWNPYPQHSFPTDDRPYHELRNDTWQKRSLNLKAKPYGGFIHKDAGIISSGGTSRTSSSSSVRPTMFRYLEDIPMGHPNAVIKEKGRLVRIKRFIDLTGQLQVERELVTKADLHVGLKSNKFNKLNAQAAQWYGDNRITSKKINKPKTSNFPPTLWTDGGSLTDIGPSDEVEAYISYDEGVSSLRTTIENTAIPSERESRIVRSFYMDEDNKHRVSNALKRKTQELFNKDIRVEPQVAPNVVPKSYEEFKRERVEANELREAYMNTERGSRRIMATKKGLPKTIEIDTEADLFDGF